MWMTLSGAVDHICITFRGLADLSWSASHDVRTEDLKSVPIYALLR